MISLILLAIMVSLMALRVPVSISIGIAVLVALIVGDFPLDVIPHLMTDGLDSFPLLAVPFFVLAGNPLLYFMWNSPGFPFQDAEPVRLCD